MVFFTSRPEFQYFADFAIFNQRLDDFENGRVLADVRNSQLQIPLLRFLNRTSAFGKSSTEGLFHVNVTPCFSCSDDHVVMLVNPSRTNCNHVEFFLHEHFAEVRIDFFGVRPFLSGDAADCVLIGKRDNVNIGHFRESDIDSMAIVALARTANDTHSNSLASCGSCSPAELRSQNSRDHCNGTILQEFASRSSFHGDSHYWDWKR